MNKSKYGVDYNELESKIFKKAYKYDEVKDRVEKVAFDVVRFKDKDNNANLWKIESSKDGDYIVAMYDEDDSDEMKVESSWEVELLKVSKDLQFYYKGTPILKMASSKLAIEKDDIDNFVKELPKKLASNKKLVKSLLNELGESTKKDVLNRYPELV